jgi:hypothetical protein
MTINKMKELGIRNVVTDEFLEPPVWCFPYDRCRSIYFEQDLTFDPLDMDTIKKIKRAYSELSWEMRRKGGTVLVAVPSIAKTLLRPYSELLRRIKRILDPKGIMSPGLSV